MNRKRVLAVTGLLVYGTGLLLLLPFALALLDGHHRAVEAYGLGIAACALTGLVMRLLGRGGGGGGELHRKDAFGIVALTWLCLGVFGALPIWAEGAIPDPAGALFEAVSGFTTTGATVVADVDGLSRATNLWRCLMHWIGGMGIVVLFVAVFPQLGVGAKQLFKTEVPGPISEGLKPRIRDTALALWWIYLGATALCAGLLWWFGMSPYDAVCHAFSTLGTGGYSTRSASIGAYGKPAIDWTIVFFMLLAGMNFGLYYGAVRGRWRDLWRNPEIRFYLLFNLALVLAVAWLIVPKHGDPLQALRRAAFQVTAVTTTTGFMTEDFDVYPDLARYLLFLAMFVGGCTGSTAGGIKAMRVLLLGKLAWRELKTTLQPHGVFSIRLGRHPIPPTVLSAIAIFTVTYLAIFVVASGLLVAMGMDLDSGMSAAIACLSSIGPGLAKVGPSQNYGFIPWPGKLLLSFCMLAGRLEIFALFAVFTPECWRR